jgi:hypothetical protein
MILALFGVALIAFTLWNISRNEASLILVIDFLCFFDFKRTSCPLIFWTIISLQFSVGFFFVVAGVFNHDISWLFG